MEDADLHGELAELQRLHAAGVLSDELYRAALKGLGRDPETSFDQRAQQVQQYDAGPGTSSKARAVLGVKPQDRPPQPFAPGLQQLFKGGTPGDLLAHGGLDQAFVLPQQRVQTFWAACLRAGEMTRVRF